jgi:hypothetical protein
MNVLSLVPHLNLNQPSFDLGEAPLQFVARLLWYTDFHKTRWSDISFSQAFLTPVKVDAESKRRHHYQSERCLT